MPLPLNYSLRSVWVRRGTTIATVGGVALVVFVLATSQMLAAGLRKTLRSSGSPDKAIVLQQSAYAEPGSHLTHSVLGLISATPGVLQGDDGQPLLAGESVAQVLLASTRQPGRVVSVFVRGTSANSVKLRPFVRVVQGRAPQPGTDEGMIGARVAGRYEGLDLGGSVELKTGRKIHIVGVFEAAQSSYESEVWVDLDALRTSLSWGSALSSVTVQLASRDAFDTFARELVVQSHQEAVAERESEYYSRISNGLSRIITGLGGVIAAIFSFGAMLGAAITMYSSIGQRTKEIGVFRAIGFKRGHVLGALLLEAGTLAMLGAFIGAGLALTTTALELATINVATGAQISLRFEPGLRVLAISALVGVVVGLLGGLFPALKAARVDPIAALRS